MPRRVGHPKAVKAVRFKVGDHAVELVAWDRENFKTRKRRKRIGQAKEAAKARRRRPTD